MSFLHFEARRETAENPAKRPSTYSRNVLFLFVFFAILDVIAAALFVVPSTAITGLLLTDTLVPFASFPQTLRNVLGGSPP